jgi:hypothetical protein
MSQRSRSLREGFGPWRWLRGRLRALLLRLTRRIHDSDEGRAALALGPLRGLLACRPDWPLDLVGAPGPYGDLGNSQLDEQPALRKDVIFITARFRSGSTLLWNLFRRLDGFTAYYEPFNERRWFDPRTRGSRVDATHRHVEDYWREFEGLEELGQYYDESWCERDLYMDAQAWMPAMKKYLEILIARAAGQPVLQKNRIDFRLPWVRHNFPNAKIIHLYRHPRDQWCSALQDITCFPADGRTADFGPHDKFYLLKWCRDLRFHFPFLDEATAEHPYQLHYFVWKLSYLAGRKDAHISVRFEDLVDDPAAQLRHLFHGLELGVERYDLDELKKVIVKPEMGKWQRYASEEWFRRHESYCETVLAEFFGVAPSAPATREDAARSLVNGCTR